MDAVIVAAVIGACATIVAALIAVVPMLRRHSQSQLVGNAAVQPADATPARLVYFRHEPHHILNFGGKNCRIEALDGSPSFLAPTCELFHDADQTRRITRDSIVVAR